VVEQPAASATRRIVSASDPSVTNRSLATSSRLARSAASPSARPARTRSASCSSLLLRSRVAQAPTWSCARSGAVAPSTRPPATPAPAGAADAATGTARRAGRRPRHPRPRRRRWRGTPRRGTAPAGSRRCVATEGGPAARARGRSPPRRTPRPAAPLRHPRGQVLQERGRLQEVQHPGDDHRSPSANRHRSGADRPRRNVSHATANSASNTIRNMGRASGRVGLRLARTTLSHRLRWFVQRYRAGRRGGDIVWFMGVTSLIQ
jgi:hypothetical protein